MTYVYANDTNSPNNGQFIAALRKKCPVLSYSGPYFPVFSPNAEKYRPE